MKKEWNKISDLSSLLKINDYSISRATHGYHKIANGFKCKFKSNEEQTLVEVDK